MYPTQQQQFVAAVSGTTNTKVTWQVTGAGTIDPNGGMYTAPSEVPNPATVTVTAISQASILSSGNAYVTILPTTHPGNYPFTITATVGSLTQSIATELVVD
jgi:hypothetical protein